MKKVLFLLVIAEFILSIAFASASINIDSCQELNVADTYVLTQDVSSSGTCFVITTNDVILNADNHLITGDIVSISVRENPDAYSFNIINANLNGNIIAYGKDAIDFDTPGGNGAEITIENSKIKNIDNHGGTGTTANSLTATPGSGGKITISNSEIETINSYGGIRTGSDSAGINGGSGGSIDIFNSSISEINNYGGEGAGNSGGGGNGGDINIEDSIVNLINSYGGMKSSSSSGDESTSGNGGDIYAFNSVVNEINNYGGESLLGSAGNGGNIEIENSRNIGKINAYGGAGHWVTIPFVGQQTGNGGYITIINSTLKASLISIDNSRGIYYGGFDGLIKGNPGVLELINASIYNSNGAIKFYHVLTEKGLNTNTCRIAYNYATVYSANYPDYNKEAEVTLNNIPSTLIIPKIFKNSNICTDCVNLTSFKAINVTFKVKNWYSYSIRETYTRPRKPFNVQYNHY